MGLKVEFPSMAHDVKRDFFKADGISSHVRRRTEIVKKHPEVREYYGPYNLSTLYIVLIVGFQFLAAFFLREQHFLVVLLFSYLVGAFANHSLYVLIHECTHNLVFKSAFANKLMGLVCDFPLVIPSAMGFRKYHMMHHKHLGEYSYDPDIASYREGELIKKSPIRKALWLFFFSLSQALRPIKVRHYTLFDRWIFINFIINTAICAFIWISISPTALLYLALSTLFALGLHPLGGRWIQEHYVTKEGQETYSYYGPLNKLSFNVGFHNEHHDFMYVPWAHLPKIKAIAPEYYQNLKSYDSWTKVLLGFIFDKNLDLFSRIVYPDRPPKGRTKDSTAESELYTPVKMPEGCLKNI